MFNMIYWFVCRKLQAILCLQWGCHTQTPHPSQTSVSGRKKKVEAGKTPQVVAGIREGRSGELSKRNWHRKKMLDALEKQLKNSKHEDGKLENFICFESKSKAAAAAVVLWGGFRRRGGYYGEHVRGGRAWRVAVGGLCNPRGNPSRRQETEAFVLRLPFQRESKVPPKLCGRLTLAGVPDNSLYPL